MFLKPLDSQFAATRNTLKIVATHVVARARHQATGRFGLRVTPGGLGTPEFGPDLERVRISGGLLIRESGGTTGAWSRSINIDGSSLAELAAFAGVDLAAEFSAGEDTPPMGDIDEKYAVNIASAIALGEWYDLVIRALDQVVPQAPEGSGASLVQLWPEHFDVSIDLAAAPEQRANFGGSPGDGFHADPYLYVGPWTDARPGDASYWNAPFGAILGYESLFAAADPIAMAANFYLTGIRAFAS
jgi:hypothetical protein